MATPRGECSNSFWEVNRCCRRTSMGPRSIDRGTHRLWPVTEVSFRAVGLGKMVAQPVRRERDVLGLRCAGAVSGQVVPTIMAGIEGFSPCCLFRPKSSWRARIRVGRTRLPPVNLSLCISCKLSGVLSGTYKRKGTRQNSLLPGPGKHFDPILNQLVGAHRGALSCARINVKFVPILYRPRRFPL
jgi:hypothetical protein